MSSSVTKAVDAMRNLPKSSGEAPGLPHLSHCRLLSSGAGIVSIWDRVDGFEHAIAFGKVPSSRAACREAFGHHLPGLHPIEEIEEVVGVASHDGASEPDQLSRAAIEDAEVVALSSLLCQLVQFIGDGVVPPALHVAADVPEVGPFAESSPDQPATSRESHQSHPSHA